MQVKKRINRFFGSILRKDKVQLEDPEEASSSSQSQVKSKQGNKSNQSYSQWDLMEHIAGEPMSPVTRNQNHENLIFSDGLAFYTEEELDNLNDENLQLATEELTEKKQRSFLKRGGSLLRRSLRRSKKKSKNKENEDADFKWEGMDSESMTNVVHEINTTLLAMATFSAEDNAQPSFSGGVQVEENSTIVLDLTKRNNPFEGNNLTVEHFRFEDMEEWHQQEGKLGLKSGLKRQASKLASKFQRNPGGSVRLKSTASMESFPNTNRKMSASFSPNTITDAAADLKEGDGHKRNGSFRRKLSFKQAKKVVRKGVTSFGKSMMHASAVMPIAYESPPVTFYPDYDDNQLPHDLVRCYYRTISYQQKDYNAWNDKVGHQQGHSTRPASFYQHGYCYNG